MQGTGPNPSKDERLVAPGDMLAALGLLTRLPVPVNASLDQARSAKAVWAYPLVGLVVGGIAALVGLIAIGVGLPVPIAAGLVLLAMIVTTGALHEDGLADTADGFWGGWDPARRLEIMKDSHIGSYGVIALIFSLGLRWSALSALMTLDHPSLAILAAAVLSRAPMVALMAALPHARTTGLSTRVGRPSAMSALLASLVAVALGSLLLGWPVLTLVLVLIVTTLVLGLLAKSKIDGQTGDVLGATQQASEITVLATLAALTP